MNSAPPALRPKPCKRCGAPGKLMKAGSNRFWVECSHMGENGNCTEISRQADSRKGAIDLWNASCAR
ncbi:hypothetical protein FNU76_12650 [Chitinimonas arctica]|uniref:Restriction alleviation protein, Lar family n=1 Tax=Chitinimonas arctica TaxID=2594795 RepID=A0A516SG53_9NEIS|nr:Lar family restriction alleviation protein [Chitinimonas arctica]QDQ27144.1 hypothetical protein FNU76_12650 [Chitinimonas arctica]